MNQVHIGAVPIECRLLHSVFEVVLDLDENMDGSALLIWLENNVYKDYEEKIFIVYNDAAANNGKCTKSCRD